MRLRALGDADAGQDTVDGVDEDDHVGGLGRGGAAARAHGDADIGGSQCRRVVDPVPDHHHRPVFAFGEDDEHFLLGCRSGMDVVERQMGGGRFCSFLGVARGEDDMRQTFMPEIGEKFGGAFAQLVRQNQQTRPGTVDGDADRDRAGRVAVR